MGSIKFTCGTWSLLEHVGESGRWTRSNVEEIQRSRILVAMAEEVAMRGASSVTMARLVARAGVSRRIFYGQFADIEDCFLAAFDRGIEQARAVAAQAYIAETGWRERIRTGLAAVLRLFDEQPLLAQLCIVHAAGGSPRVLEHRSRVMAELREVIDRGPDSGSRVPGTVVAEGVVGAVLAVLYTRVLARGGDTACDDAGSVGDEQPLIALHGELMSLIVLPYLGARTAAREQHRPAPAPRSTTHIHSARPVGRFEREGPAARVGYRTLRVLSAIAELPAGSNREVAEGAGVVDQGQISKILTRLELQGLVVNRRAPNPARGTPNAWWLTERGEEIERKLREGKVGNQPAAEPQPGNGSGSRRPTT